MPRYIIEEDNEVIETCFYAVEADSLDEAIDKTSYTEPYALKSYYSSEAPKYTDSREATDEEWAELFPETLVDNKI